MKLKKLMAVTLCATMALPVVAFAKPIDESEFKTEEAIKSVIEYVDIDAKVDIDFAVEELSMLAENYGMTSDYLTEIKTDDSGDYTYVFKYADLVEEITPIENELGSGFIVKEGDKIDEYIESDNGDIYLDGNMVKFDGKSYSEYLEGNAIETDQVTRGKIDIYYTDSCPSGTKGSEYNVLYKEKTNASIDLEKDVQYITAGVLTVLLWKAVIIFTCGAATGYSDLVYIVGPVILKRLIATDPYARYISAGDKTYTHKNGQDISLTKAVWKHVLVAYTGEDFEEKAGQKTYYEVRENNM